MEGEFNKIDKVLGTLKRSGPVLKDSEALSENVIRQIQDGKEAIPLVNLVYELLFGWIYVGWLRRIMVTSAVMIVLLFGFQQAVILKRINSLSGKTYIEAGVINTSMPGEINGIFNKHKLFGKKPSAGDIYVSEKEIENLIKSLNDLQVRYRDLFELIESDPELKKYVDERLNTIGVKKPKI